MNTEKRSSTHQTAQVRPTKEGVGARPRSTATASEGGGYLNTYRFCEFEKPDFAQKQDPRLLHLRKIGLSATLQKIAAEIGVDNFLKMWQLLDAADYLRDESGSVVLRIRSFKAWLRSERNRYIKALNDEGYSRRDIQKKVAEQYDERLDPTYIYRLKQK